jgi:hypothetical protein
MLLRKRFAERLDGMGRRQRNWNNRPVMAIRTTP